MTAETAQWTLDVHDVPKMARFWAAVLDYEVQMGDDEGAHLYSAAGGRPTVWLQPTTEPKRSKNRCHPDLRPQDGDVEAEVHRLLELGAGHVDVGQRDDDPFVVLQDPEGNEFCILRSEPRLHRSRE